MIQQSQFSINKKYFLPLHAFSSRGEKSIHARLDRKPSLVPKGAISNCEMDLRAVTLGQRFWGLNGRQSE